MAKFIYGVSPTSVIIRFKLMDSTVATGAGLTGLTFSSTGLRVSTIKTNESSATAYTAAGSTIETITTLGTYAAPTATKCRFKEVDATNHPGVYELQLADARFSATDSLLVAVNGATNLAQSDFEIECRNLAANITQVNGTAAGTSTAQLGVNVVQINAVSTSAVTTVNANIGQTQPINFTGTGASALVNNNTIQINSISTSAVTTVNANQGTTQIINFTGTGASATVKTDLINIAGSSVNVSAAQLGVNVVQVNSDATAATNIKADYLGTSTDAQKPWTAKYISDCIDYQRGHHTQTGKTVYVDGTGGNDSTGVGSRSLPYKTISKALTDCTSNAHDQIILLPNISGGPTVISESASIAITKNYVQIRGPGRDVNITNTSNTDVFSVSASGVGMSGFRVTTAGGTANAITIATGDFNRIQKVWIESAHQDAINTTLANRTEIIDCYIVAAARDGIRINSGGSAGNYSIIQDCLIRGIVGIGINLGGVNASYSRIQRNTIRDCGTGISIASGTLSTVVSDNRLANNTTHISDSGTSTYRQWNWLTTDTNGFVTTSSVSTGAAINQTASTWTNLSTPVATTETGGVANTVARDGIYDVLTNASQAGDSYYEFSIGGAGIPTALSIYGAVQVATRTCAVYGYNWGSSAWVQIGTMTGTNGLTPAQYNFALYTSMVGTGANIGKVRIRFLASAATTTVSIDQLYVSYASVNQSVGYLEGAIWVDTVSGTAGTTLYVNGTADKPVNSLADALTLADALGVKKLKFSPDSSITLTRSFSYWILDGKAYISLNGQDISDAVFIDSELVSGVGTGDDADFHNCNIGTSTLGQVLMTDCLLYGTVTMVANKVYNLLNCADGNPGTGATPRFTFAANSSLGLRNWRGGIELADMASTNAAKIDGAGRVNLIAGASGGTVSIRGNFELTDGTSGTVAITDTARFNEDQNITNVTGSVALIGTNGITSASIDASADLEIAGAVWEELRAGHTTSGTFGEYIKADAVRISTDSTAADNLKLQFNGTGVIGDAYPSRQDQLKNIVSTGAATNVSMSSWTNLSTPVATTETGGVSATIARDGIYDVLTNASQAADFYYETDIGGRGVPTGVSIYGAVQNNAKTVSVYGYVWASSSWIQIGTMTGTTGLVPSQYTFGMYTSMVGTGANLGKVRIRFLASASSTTVSIDQMYMAYTTVPSVGYLNGAVWVDTVNGTAGTTLYTNGTADKPVSNLADAITIATALGLKRLHFSTGSSVVLSTSMAGWEITGDATIALNGKNIAGAIFTGAHYISGVGIGIDAEFYNSIVDTVTLDSCTMKECSLVGAFTMTSASTYNVVNCIDADPTTTSPTFNWAANAAASFRNYRGGLYFGGMASTNTVKADGYMRLVLNSNCTGGDITFRGFGTITDNVVGGFAGTINQNARFATDQILSSDISKVYGVSAAAQRLSVSAPTMLEGTVTSAAFSPTTTVFEVGNISTSATDFYKTRTVIFTSGSLNKQARQITGYSLQGGNGRFTVDALTSAPVHGDTFIIV